MSADREDRQRGGRGQRTGSVHAADPDLTTWLHALWARNEPPDRLEVHQMFGRNKALRGEMIHHVDFKPNAKLDVEQVNRLANEIVAAAQNDCDSVERKSSYQIAVTDRNRGASQLVRRLGPLAPKRQQLARLGEAGDPDDDDDGAPPSVSSLALQYTKEANEQARWDRQRYDAVMGGILMMQQTIIQDQRKFLDDMMQRQMQMFTQLEDAKNLENDRIVKRKMAEFKVTLLEDGLRTARNLLPGLFGGGGGAAPAAAPTGGGAAPPRDYGFSPERAVVDNLLTDCERTGVSVKLFGDWSLKDGKVALTGEPGIFSPQQLAVLLGVQAGRLPADSLDALMPDSGSAIAITQEQIILAQPLMTEGTGTSLLQLVGLRRPRPAANDT